MKGQEQEQNQADMKEREPKKNHAHRKEQEPGQNSPEIQVSREEETSQDMLSGEKAARFDREELLASKRYRGCRDLAEALLEKGRQYTVEEADGLIGSYMKGKVV